MHRTQSFQFQLDALMIEIVDVGFDAVLQALDAVEPVGMEELGFEHGKKLSMAALSRQLPLRDMLWATSRALSRR